MIERTHTTGTGGTVLVLTNGRTDSSQRTAFATLLYQHVVQGELDRYPDRPEGYDGIVVDTDATFWRWARWHFQDLSRQLKPGGMLFLRGCPYAGPQGFSLTNRIKRLVIFSAWKAAAMMGSRTLHTSLVPCAMRKVAGEWGLELVRQPQGARLPRLPRGVVSLVKGQRIAKAVQESDTNNIDRLLSEYFGEWGIPSSNTRPQPEVRAVSPASLIAGVENPRAFVLSPHPDDELIGCGGTLLGLIEAGARVDVLQMTEGSTCIALRDVQASARRRVRWTEAQSVADRCGFTNHYWHTGDSGLLENSEGVRERLRSLFHEIKPTVVFIPAATDRHPEHRLAHQLFQHAAGSLAKDCKVLEYPVWGFLPTVGLAVDVSRRYPEVLDALYLYKTAMKAVDYASRCHVLARWNGHRFTGTNRLVETFAFYNDRGMPPSTAITRPDSP